jgi:hypothetical protein
VTFRPDVLAEFLRSPLPPSAVAFVMDIASGEINSAQGFETLAGGGAMTAAMCGGTLFARYPVWDGIPDSAGTSHGAGAFQWERRTAASITAGTGVTTFYSQDQINGSWWWAKLCYHAATERDLGADLAAGYFDSPGHGPAGLGNQWDRGKVAGPGSDRYAGFLAQVNQGRTTPASPAPPVVPLTPIQVILAGANFKDGVRAFQAARGLGVDGVIGPHTLAALNAG